MDKLFSLRKSFLEGLQGNLSPQNDIEPHRRSQSLYSLFSRQNDGVQNDNLAEKGEKDNGGGKNEKNQHVDKKIDEKDLLAPRRSKSFQSDSDNLNKRRKMESSKSIMEKNNDMNPISGEAVGQGGNDISFSWMKSFATLEYNTYLKSLPFQVENVIVDPSLLPIMNILLPANDNITYNIHLYSQDHDFIGNSVFILRNRLETVHSFSKWIKKEILKNTSSDANRSESLSFALCLTPSRNLLLEKQLEFQGVLGSHTKIGELRTFSCFPLSEQYFEMAMGYALRDMCLYHDYSSLVDVARVLATWDVSHSEIYIGKWSIMTKQILSQMKEKIQNNATFRKEKIAYCGSVDQLIVIDRNLDFYSPFITSYSYDAIIDNLFGINFGRLDLSKIEKVHSTTAASRIVLDSNDTVYESLKRRNISELHSILNGIAKDLRKAAEKKNTLKEIKEIRSFVENDMPVIQKLKFQLSIHLDIGFSLLKTTKDFVFKRWMELEFGILVGTVGEKSIIDFILERIVNKDPISDTFKLISLYNLVHQGFPIKKFHEIYKEFIHTFGHEIMPSINNLRRVGLFCTKEDFAKNIADVSIESYYTKSWIKMARLFQPDLEYNNPNHLGYEYTGYTPLLLKHIDLAIHDPQKLRDRVGGNFIVRNMKENLPKRRKILLFVVGGITRSELNCIKILEELSGHKIFVGSTATIRGSSLIETFL